MNEPIRLVVWDLDETFWRGTLSEGGIAYSQENHEIVVALASRGIVSSIVSKNDLGPVKEVLTESGLWDYFVFPSVNWDTKGPRLQEIVEASQLRPETILFIDDNHLNRAEALHFVPKLCVESEAIIPSLLDHPLLKGKDDSSLSRLKQYKVLEQKQVEQKSAGDNLAFLRSSEISAYIEFDIETHIDRAIELINRTNQLNFTKKRLPDDIEAARSELRGALSRFNVLAGLIRVRDKFGDYGFVGFYLQFEWRLEHFCFSCRTLGMSVENWLYEFLGKPRLSVVGPVVTDLFAPHESIDWIKQEATDELSDVPKKAGRLLVRGACESQSLAHYLAADAQNLVGEFNSSHTAFLDAAILGMSDAQLQAAEALGYRASDFQSQLLDGPETFDAIILTLWSDANVSVYRHKESGIVLPFQLPGANNGRDLRLCPLDEVERFLKAPQSRDRLDVLRREFEHLGWTVTTRNPQGVTYFEAALRRLLQRILSRTPIFILSGCERFVGPDGKPAVAHHMVEFNHALRMATSGYSNVVLIDTQSAFVRPEEIRDVMHFDRMAYHRLYQMIAQEWVKWEDGREWRKMMANVADEVERFDEEWYLRVNPDVANAVRKGSNQSALWHYLRFGRAEGREPYPQFDADWYARAYPFAVQEAGSTEPAALRSHFEKRGPLPRLSLPTACRPTH